MNPKISFIGRFDFMNASAAECMSLSLCLYQSWVDFPFENGIA
jgi:hypothetical protein